MQLRKRRAEARRLSVEQLESRAMLAAFDLAAYEVNRDTTFGGTTLRDFSGVAYRESSDTILIINNAGAGDLVEYTRSGAYVQTIDLDNFSDPEAIFPMGGNAFSIIEEDNLGTELNQEFDLSVIPVVGSGDIDKTALDDDMPNEGTISLTHANLDDGTNNNNGPEGVAYDAVGGFFYFAKEADDIRIFRVPEDGGTVEEVDIDGVTSGVQILADVSDIYFTREVGGDGGRLFLLSDDSQLVIMADLDETGLDGSVVLDEFDDAVAIMLPQIKFEGIGFSPDAFEMWLVSDWDSGLPERRYQQYRNFTVYDPPAPDLTSGSDTGESSTDDVTSDNTPTFTGTLERTLTTGSVPVENAWVWLYVDETQVGSPVQANSSGVYTITAPTISAGERTIQIKTGQTNTTPDAQRSPLSDPLTITIDTTAPRVESVVIGSSYSNDSLHPDYAVPDGDGDQLRTPPVAASNEIKITFSDAMAQSGAGELDDDSLTITRVSDDGTDVDVVGFSWNAGSKTGTWTFDIDDDPDTWPYARGQFVLTLDDAVTNVAGLALDGEWTNPTSLTDTNTSTFPSGNGTAGGDFEFYITLLPGDVNRDNLVDNGDVAALLGGGYGQGSGQTWTDGDMTGEGAAGLSDLIKIQNNLDADYTQWPGEELLHGGGGGGGDGGGGQSFHDFVMGFLESKHGLSPEAVDEILAYLKELDS